jgi:hypothetical protein
VEEIMAGDPLANHGTIVLASLQIVIELSGVEDVDMASLNAIVVVRGGLGSICASQVSTSLTTFRH